MENTPQSVTVNGKTYPYESLSETARNQITNLGATDQEIGRTQAVLAMLQTARQAYSRVLKEEMDKMEAAAETTVKH